MTDGELKRLRRSELLEMLIAQSREIQTLQARLDAAEKQLQARELAVKEAGSIAEASLRISGVFEAVQDACKLYIDNIRRLDRQQATLYAETKAQCAKMLELARVEAARIRASAEIAPKDGEQTHEAD